MPKQQKAQRHQKEIDRQYRDCFTLTSQMQDALRQFRHVKNLNSSHTASKPRTGDRVNINNGCDVSKNWKNLTNRMNHTLNSNAMSISQLNLTSNQPINTHNTQQNDIQFINLHSQRKQNHQYIQSNTARNRNLMTLTMSSGNVNFNDTKNRNATDVSGQDANLLKKKNQMTQDQIDKLFEKGSSKDRNIRGVVRTQQGYIYSHKISKITQALKQELDHLKKENECSDHQQLNYCRLTKSKKLTQNQSKAKKIQKPQNKRQRIDSQGNKRYCPDSVKSKQLTTNHVQNTKIGGQSQTPSQRNLRFNNNFLKKIKFLDVDDKRDKLLTGMPCQSQDSDYKQDNVHQQDQFQGKISQMFKQKEQISSDLTAIFKRDYLVGKIVGEGAYASVRVAIYKPLNRKIAIKVYEKSKIKQPQRKKSVRREIRILELLNHPNIVQIYDVVQTNHHLNIVMEYLSGISLNSYLKDNPGHKISEKNARKIIKPLVLALKHIHERNIAHRDIKLENVILDDELTPKLIDFGFSTCIEADKKIKIFCGTPSYMAPQIVQKKEYRGEPADIWALGVLFFVSMTGLFPFKGSTDQQLYRKINSGEFPRNELVTYSKELNDLISRMLKVRVEDRISAQQILEHSWINKTTLQLGNQLNFKNPPSITPKVTSTINASKKTKRVDSSQHRKRVTTTISSNKDRQTNDTNTYSNFTNNSNCTNNFLNHTGKLNNIYPLPLEKDKDREKLADTYKENLKLQLRVVKQSPSNISSNKVSSTTNRRQEKLEKEFGQIRNIDFNNCKALKTSNNDNDGQGYKYERIQSNFPINPHTLKYNKKQYFNKTNSKVLDLLRLQMKRRQQQKSKSKSKSKTKVKTKRA